MASSSAPKGSQAAKKRKQTGTSSDAPNRPVPSIDVSRFDSPATFRKFIKTCSDREIVIERIFDEAFLRRIEFPWLDRLKQWGWWQLISEGEVHPHLVRLFYYLGDNATYDDDGNKNGEKSHSFITNVLDRQIIVDGDTIRECFARNVVKGSGNCIPHNFPLIEKCQLVYDDPTIMCYEKRTSKMSLNARILHLLVCQVFFPRSGDFANASKRDIFWMSRIMEDDPPDLCALIVVRMLEAVKLAKSAKSSHGLPYGKLVSNLCRRMCVVPTSELIDNHSEMSIFNEQSVLQMGWKLDHLTGVWVRKGEREQQPLPAIEGEQPMGSMLSEIQGMFSNLQTSMDNQFNQVGSSFNEMGSRLDLMDNRMGRIEGYQKALEDQNLFLYQQYQAFQNSTPFDQPFPHYHPPDQ